ncbi:Glutathione S-transferase [Burkholderiales bacterium 8X]|nr:Glutathione S-transferase [Burkholderiales bacterium 8X]
MAQEDDPEADLSLVPHPEGAAAAPSLPVLYSFRRCPFAMRARMAILASGQRCELREVLLRDKPPEFLAASPKGTVPVLVEVDGRVIDESLDIMLWALRRSDPERWLPAEGDETAASLALIARCDGEFKRHLDGYKYPGRLPGLDASSSRNAGAGFLEELDARLATRAGLMADRTTLADIAIAPFVRQFAQVDRDWFDAQPWRHLAGWLAERLQSPVFAQAMAKHPVWRTNSASSAMSFG